MTHTMVRLPSQKQLDYALALARECATRNTEARQPITEALREGYLESLTDARRMSGWITLAKSSLEVWRFEDLKTHMYADPEPRAKVAITGTPAGRYAVQDGDTLRFIVVDRPTEGRWAGYTFVKEQASDSEYPVKDRERKARYLALIDTDPKAASVRYGRELGVCGICGRTLTNEASREAGIGPDCASKF